MLNKEWFWVLVEGACIFIVGVLFVAFCLIFIAVVGAGFDALTLGDQLHKSRFVWAILLDVVLYLSCIFILRWADNNLVEIQTNVRFYKHWRGRKRR